MQYYNKTGSLNFPIYAKDLVASYFKPFSQFKKSPQEVRLRLGNHFLPNRYQKTIFLIFPETFLMAKGVSARKTTYLKPKSALKSKGYTLTK